MNNIKKFTTVFLLASLVGCQTPPTHRTPGSIGSIITSKEWEELRSLKQRKVELDAMSIHFQKKKNEFHLEKIVDEQKKLNKRIGELEAQVGTFEAGSKQVIFNQSSNWRSEKEAIELGILDLYTLDKKVQFSVSTYEAGETHVKLTHKLFSNSGYVHMSSEDPKPTMNFTMKCDAPFEIKQGLGKKKIPANQTMKFVLGDKALANDYRDLFFHPDMKSCDVKFVSSLNEKGAIHGFKLINETSKLKTLEPMLSSTEICSVKKDSGKFFDTTEFPNMTCPVKYEAIKILPEPEDSLYARVTALLGRDLPADFVKNGNPYAELDLSKAPKYDALLVSYLVFRADFYGTLMARLLAYHADQGAVVRIVVSGVIAHSKDKVMFEKMMARHPNVKVVRYEFDNKQQGGAWISEFHRTNHVKLFIAYSKENPENSMVILGGRNIHDGFVFRTPVDVAKFPEIVNYASGDDSWAYWRDFEMVVTGQDFTESLVRHYLNFYHINKDNLVMRLSSVPVAKENVAESEEESLRHYVSIPFKDAPNLNMFYANLIDTAKKKILISSPYFRPVKEIHDALQRAIDRGVDITIITRLDLEGDTADFILGAVNKDGVNKFLKKVKVFEYTEPKVILHSKLLMIDDEVSFISSVNLNKRSFYHDLENGVVINDRKFTKEMGVLYKEYMKISQQLTEKQKIVFWKKWVIKIFDKVL